MLDTILASYGGSGLILCYLEWADTVFSYVDKKREQHLEEALKDIDKISNILEQVEKEMKNE